MKANTTPKIVNNADNSHIIQLKKTFNSELNTRTSTTNRRNVHVMTMNL